MKQTCLWLLLLSLNLISIFCRGQARSIPPEITVNFNKMFPDAADVQWRDKINNFAAFFKLKGAQCEAKFAPTGNWISTEEAIQWDSIPPTVIDSLKSCKYSDWTRTSAYILSLPGGMTQYHVVVTKSDMGRKILFFNPSGQLLTDH